MFSVKDTGQAAINFQNKYLKKLGNLNVLMLGKEHGRPGCGWLQSRDKRVVSLYFLHLRTDHYKHWLKLYNQLISYDIYQLLGKTN